MSKQWMDSLEVNNNIVKKGSLMHAICRQGIIFWRPSAQRVRQPPNF